VVEAVAELPRVADAAAVGRGLAAAHAIVGPARGAAVPAHGAHALHARGALRIAQARVQLAAGRAVGADPRSPHEDLQHGRRGAAEAQVADARDLLLAVGERGKDALRSGEAQLFRGRLAGHRDHAVARILDD